MIGWIILILFALGGVLLLISYSSPGASGEERMGDAFLGLFGWVIIGVAVVIFVGRGIWSML